MTIKELIYLKESEDKVEFKEAKGGNLSYNGGTKLDISKRRRCILGYVIAFANEGGGYLVFGIKESLPHIVVGSNQSEREIGALESRIYNDTGIRVEIIELFDDNKLRVLVIKIPVHPVGRVFKFEDVPLMRVGEELKPMSDEQYLKIIQEQESDFSATICEKLTINDLDANALSVLKEKYAKKQQNENFVTQSNEQILIDLELLQNNKLTYAALILLGKKEKIKEYLPQSAINLEYRENNSTIEFEKRTIFRAPYFLLIDELWKIIDVRNKHKHIQIGLHIIDIPEFNKEIIREAINNAVAHRDYRKNSEIVIKQSKNEFSITNHGGFPVGVTIKNIIEAPSTPRNRLIADTLTKAGFVERSGQGVDKIFYQNLKEGKDFPFYSDSDVFQVTLKIPITILYPAFNLFFNEIQNGLNANKKLSVQYIIVLAKIRDKINLTVNDKKYINRLIEIKAIRKNKDNYILSKKYTKLTEQFEGSDADKIINLIKNKDSAKMSEIVELFYNRLTRRQINNMVYNLVNRNVLIKKGKGKNTIYILKN